MTNNQTIKTYSLGVIKEHGIERLQGLPLMTMDQAKDNLNTCQDSGATNVTIINVNSE